MNVLTDIQDSYVHNDTIINDLTLKGVNLPKEPLLEDMTPLPKGLGKLATETIYNLRTFFKHQTSHQPSQAMWDALTDLAGTLERMADGECPPLYHLSSLDPGVGKTRTIIHFIQALMSSPDHDTVGVLLCVSRLDEIRKLSEEMGLSDDDFAVFTSDDTLNALGSGRPSSARVFFTTQQMVERRCEGRLFEDVDVFHFHGRPRMVRIWDEAILPGQTLTLNRDDIGHLFAPLRSRHPKLAEAIETLFVDLKDVKDNGTIFIPNFEDDHKVNLNDVLRLFSDVDQSHQRAAMSLWMLSGKDVSVRRDGAFGNTVLDYKETLPEDFAPVVILDASGRVRTTYQHWEDRRGTLVSLRKANKRYDDLTVHVWNKGGGKTAFRSDGEKLINAIASTINTKPTKEWLVIHHKTEAGFDVVSGVTDLLHMSLKNVHFVHWGNHHGTNDYAHVQNVILAGTLFYRPSYYESMGRLGSGFGATDRLTEKDYNDVMIGEHKHLVLQALCRGSVRQCEGNVCAPCNAYIIVSVRSGIKEALPDIFPGCKVKRWKPLGSALKGKAAMAMSIIKGRLEKNPNSLVKFTDVMASIGMKDSKNFRRSIRNHPDFQDALAEEGIVEHGYGKWNTGFAYLAHTYGF